VDVGVSVGPARLRYGLDVVADLRADLSGSVTVPPRALQSVGARVTLPYGPHVVTFALDVSNLFDVRVASYAGLFGPVREPIGDLYEYPLPGRAFLASVRLTSPR
jgi:outer membrane receptor protein involved in Fe transport